MASGSAKARCATSSPRRWSITRRCCRGWSRAAGISIETRRPDATRQLQQPWRDTTHDGSAFTVSRESAPLAHTLMVQHYFCLKWHATVHGIGRARPTRRGRGRQTHPARSAIRAPATRHARHARHLRRHRYVRHVSEGRQDEWAEWLAFLHNAVLRCTPRHTCAVHGTFRRISPRPQTSPMHSGASPYVT